MRMLQDQRKLENLEYIDEVCLVRPTRVIPNPDKEDKYSKFILIKPCGVDYKQHQTVHCDKWEDGSCEYLIYMGDVPSIVDYLLNGIPLETV